MSAVLSQPNNKLQLGLCAGSLENGPLGNRAEDGTSVPLAGDATKKNDGPNQFFWGWQP